MTKSRKQTGMTGRELVASAIRFEGPERLAISLPEQYGSDFAGVGMSPSPDARPSVGVDEWGAVWENIGVCNLGQVKDFPVKNWSDLDELEIPEIDEPRRWGHLSHL